MKYYAVREGRRIGVFHTWGECKMQVDKYPHAVYKSFLTKHEAEQFIIKPFPSSYHENSVSRSEGVTPVKRRVDPKQTYVYTDGSCPNNGYNSIAGVGVWFGPDNPWNISKRIVGTNNIAELTAILECYPYVHYKDDVTICTDSKYAILCATSYGRKMAAANWSPEIPNRELVRKVYELYKDTTVKFLHVRAHTNESDPHSIGNHHADRLAVLATRC